jgi:glycosyltransferase involved in cell wall biosynthesis
VVGRSPTRAVRRLDNGASIHVTGTVPDVTPYWQQMRVSVAPLRIARGTQVKVLMAMAAGRPSVVTPCVAAGLGAQAGRDLLVADSEAGFAEHVLDLLTDNRKAEELAHAGRAFVAEHFDAGEGMTRLEALLTNGERDEARRADPVRHEADAVCMA